jgi:DNA-binding response OmpR family regulator
MQQVHLCRLLRGVQAQRAFEHVAARRVRRAGTPIELTSKEFELLDYLARHAGEVVSRETLVREVWKESNRSGPWKRHL